MVWFCFCITLNIFPYNYLPYVYPLWWNISLQVLSPFLLDCFFFFNVKNLTFLYISYTYHLLNIWFANILSQSVVCICILSTVFNRTKVLNFYEVQFINFSLYGSCFWSKSSLPIEILTIFCFFLNILILHLNMCFILSSPFYKVWDLG